MSHFAFVSYSTTDLQWAKRVQSAIEVFGLKSFVAERDWHTGQDETQIMEAIRSAGVFVLVWSKAAADSEWVRHEVGAAAGANVPVVILRLDGAPPLPPTKRSEKYADAQTDAFDALLKVQSAVMLRYRQLAEIAHVAQAKEIEKERQAEQQRQANQNVGMLLLGSVVTAALMSKK